MDHPIQMLVLGYFGTTTLHPLGLVAVLMLGSAMVVLPRRYAVWPMIVMACFIAPAQRIVLLGLDFDLLRIMVLFGTARIMLWNEWRGFVWRPVDWAVLAWAVSGTVAYTVLHGSLAALKFKLGTSYDAIGMYFLFRMLIRNWEDVCRTIMGLTIISLPLALAFAIEWMTGRNVFAIFGGVREITWVREGRMRCQGAYAHPILAGAFWATVLPLIVSQWWQGGNRRWLAVAGTAAALLIVFASGSATPAMALIFAMVGGATFAIRYWMRSVRWLGLAAIVFLHLAMIAPVWHLLSRMNIVSGATGWHRYFLVDQAIARFGEWWLVGTESTAHWGWMLFDVTNQYVLEGIRGGVLTLALFLAIIALSFRHVGLLWRGARDERWREILAWALGVTLFVHVTTFFAVSYFGQIVMLWYLSLAMISSLDPAPQQQPRRVLLIRASDLRRWLSQRRLPPAEGGVPAAAATQIVAGVTPLPRQP